MNCPLVKLLLFASLCVASGNGYEPVVVPSTVKVGGTFELFCDEKRAKGYPELGFPKSVILKRKTQDNPEYDFIAWHSTIDIKGLSSQWGRNPPDTGSKWHISTTTVNERLAIKVEVKNATLQDAAAYMCKVIYSEPPTTRESESSPQNLTVEGPPTTVAPTTVPQTTVPSTTSSAHVCNSNSVLIFMIDFMIILIVIMVIDQCNYSKFLEHLIK